MVDTDTPSPPEDVITTLDGPSGRPDDKPVLTLTHAAWVAIWGALEESDGASVNYHPATFKDHWLRVGVKGGGCSGFEYDMDLERGLQPPAGWLTWHQQDPEVQAGECCDPPIRIAVDRVSAQYLKGVIVDFVTQGLQSGFRFANPLAKSTCGCGQSFSVKECK